MKGLVVSLALLAGGHAFAGGEGIGKGDHVLDVALSYAVVGGHAADAFHLDDGPGLGVRYYYLISRRFGLGGGVASHRFDGDRSRRGATYVDRADDEGRVLTLGIYGRFTFNPEGRIRGYAALGRTYNRIDLEERFSFREGDFADDGTVTSKANTWLAEAELGGEMSVTDQFLLRASLGYGLFATDFTHLSVAIGAGYRF